MDISNTASARLHDALHRLPGMPAHERAAELNSNAGARQHAQLRLQNRPLRSPNSHHERAPRVLPRWQAWIGSRFGQRQP
jgi:hypothetical protein